MKNLLRYCLKDNDTNIYGVSTNEFSKDLVNEFDLIKEDFCFLHVGHWLQGDMGGDRKDIGMLIKTFFETFKNQKINLLLF